MSEPVPTKIDKLIEAVLADLSPSMVNELQGWKHCQVCGCMCNWHSAKYVVKLDALVCPHCGVIIYEPHQETCGLLQGDPGVERAEPSGGEAAADSADFASY